MEDSVHFNDLGPSKPPSASFYDDMFDSYFSHADEAPEPSPKASSSPSTPPPPVFDKPVFDDDPDTADPFDAIPLFGVGGGGGGEGEDFHGGVGSAAKPEGRESESESEAETVGFDEDLLPGLGGSTNSMEEPVREVELDCQPVGFDNDLIPGFDRSMKPAPQMDPETVAFDDGVIPDFGGGTSHPYSAREEPIISQESESISSSKMSVSMPEDPFIILGGTHKSGYSSFELFSDLLNNIGMPVKEGNTKVDAPDNTSGIFQGSDIFTDFPKAMPPVSFTSENQSDTNERRHAENINSMSHSDRVPLEKPVQRASTEAPDNALFEMNFPEASVIHEVPVTTGFHTLNPFAGEDDLLEANQSSQTPNDVWVTVSDIALVTLPTSAPPPSRPPPPLAAKKPPSESVTSEAYAHHRNQGYHHSACSNTSKTSQIDELEDFFMAKPDFANGHPQVLKHEGNGHYPSAATASFMDWTDMGHSKGGNQGAFDSMLSSNQYRQTEIDEKSEVCAHEMETTDEERLENERIQREHKEEQRRAEREREEQLEREREQVRQREREEQRRREKEREARQAVEKAVREARERAAAEARMQAEKEARQRAERAAVWKAATEARERAAIEARERAAKAAAEAKEREAAKARERAAAESRERDAKVAAEARERAARAAAEAREKEATEFREKAAAEARAKAERAAVEKAAAEARRRAERAAFERVAAEARQRAANEARERAAAEARARENQPRRAAEPDLESFFGMPSRSSSVLRSYNNATTNPFDVQPHGNADCGGVRRSSSGSTSSFTQPSSINLMDGLSSIFGAPSSSAVFQEVDGESEERRKARLERHQRTMERAVKALAEKNERDLQAQREQDERHRIGESLDFEIKRWAAGKEGNLRALLSTLQYSLHVDEILPILNGKLVLIREKLHLWCLAGARRVSHLAPLHQVTIDLLVEILWPECGWRPISLTDLITAASVKKEYRKATLCIHPDKVQQKGANLQQKYIAEKVFDLLKEAWNKFNSEELF